MEFEKVRKEHIIKAIKDYQEKGLPKGFGPSSTYDICYKDQLYPPKAIMAYANYNVTGEKIKASFKGGIGTDCFNALEREGFVIKSKKGTLIELLDKGIVSLIKEFIKQADEGGLKTSIYPKNFLKLKLKVSFGQGVAARIPWIGLYKEPNTIQKGIYPVFLYYKEHKKLVLAYGISETEKVDFNWSNTKELQTIEQWHREEFNKKPDRYGSSFIKGIYDTTKVLDEDTLSKDLEELIGIYNDIDFQIDIDLKDFEERIRSNTARSNGLFFKVLDKLINDLEIQNSEKIVFSTGSNQLTFQVGKRYCLLLKKNKFGFINPIESNINELKRGEFSKPDPATFFRESSSEVFLKNYESIKVSVAFELRRDNHAKDKEYDNKIFRKYVFDKNYRNKFNNIETDEINIDLKKKPMSKEIPLNQIFYGPPGTGKTYNTVLKAAEIIENRKINSYNEALEIFKTNLHNQIEFITFHQNYSYEDFIQGLRPETDNKSSLVFDKKDGVFKKIADKALENLKLVEKDPVELSSEAKFDKGLEHFADKLLESEDNFKINDTAYIFEVEEDAFRYTGQRWTKHTNGLRMKFSDLKEFYRNDVKSRKDIKKLDNISGLANQHATYYYLVYSEILKLLPKKAEALKKVRRKNYVIIIDEINRANISRVFGELITLIEPDKRSHGKIPLEAKLPSGDPFIVPSNLFIIGTMNTADKSIALLDIALRRRFEFESMYPKYDIEGQEIYDVDILKKINQQIIKSKGHDFQIGHAYFMGENKNLIERMNKKVIPLLLEYYMNDEKEVKGILNSAGLAIQENNWPLKITGKND